jgi:hypothetical protein
MTHLVASALLIASPAAAEEIFVELAGSGLDFVHFNGHSGEFYMAEINSGGGALFDFDNDGDLDVYLTQGQRLDGKDPATATFPPRHPLPLTDRLYRNELAQSGRLAFTDVTADSGIAAAAYGFGVAAGDFDNDGWVDLYVTRLGSNTLLRNLGGETGKGRFADVTAAAGADDDRWSVPASVADFDGDGWLDLYVGNYLAFSVADSKVCRTATGARDYCGPGAYPGVPDRLFRNRGPAGGFVAFEDVTTAAGIDRVPSKTLGVVAADLDGDGLTDFYAANDLAPNQMWLQRAGGEGATAKHRVSDEALLAGSAVNARGQAEASMGVDAGDFDGDGDDDLFMTHLVRETNTLYLNDGHGMFHDATVETGLAVASLPHTSWGTAWLDYDNDGRLEMMIANGAVRVIEALANAGDPFPFHETNQLFWNTGAGADGATRFEEVTGKAGKVFELSEVSRALAAGDLDNDGDTDVLLVNNNGPARLLINAVGQDRHWLGLKLVGRDGRRDQLGARVELLGDGGPSLWRRSRTDGSFAAANDPRVLFGLGDRAAPAVLRVHWPDGTVERWDGVAVDRYTTLRQGTGKSAAAVQSHP